MNNEEEDKEGVEHVGHLYNCIATLRDEGMDIVYTRFVIIHRI